MPDAPGVAPYVPPAPGQAKIAQYRAAGMDDSAIADWRARKQQQWTAAGISADKQQAYWGETPKQAPLLDEVLAANQKRNDLANNVHVAENPLEAFAAGFNTSVTGLNAAIMARNVHMMRGQGELPIIGTKLAPDADVGQQVAAGAGQMLGDAPWMLAGLVATRGMGAGGQGGAANAFPEAMRQVLLQTLQTHPDMTADEVWGLITNGTVATAKAGVVGFGSGRAGEIVGGQATKLGLGKGIAQTANIFTMATSGAALAGALDGHIPTARDFTVAAILALGTHAGITGAGSFKPSDAGSRLISNMQTIYTRLGIRPQEVIQMAAGDPHLQQTLLQQDVTGDAIIHPLLRANAPPEPKPFGRKPPVAQPPVAGQPTPTPHLAAPPALPAEAGMMNFQRIMRAIEGGLSPSGAPRVSPAGAIGENQIMPATARQYGLTGTPQEIVQKLMDPTINREVQARITHDLYNRFHGDTEAMLAAYNAGPGRGAQLQRQGPGTRLEAVRAGGKTTYRSVPAERNEAFLPLETQRYLANARRVNGGPLAGGANAISGDYRATQPAAGGEVDGAGFVNPPKPPEEVAAEQAPLPNLAAGGSAGNAGSAGVNWSKVPTETLIDTVRQSIHDGSEQKDKASVSTVLTKWVSELEPLAQLDHVIIKEHGGDPKNQMNLQDWGRQVYGSQSVSDAMIRDGIVKWNFDAQGRPVREIVPDSASIFKGVKAATDAGGNIPDFEAFLAATRAARRAADGIKTPLNEGAAAALAADPAAKALYEKPMQTLRDAWHGVLDYAEQAGYMGKEQVQGLKDSDDIYVSFQRAERPGYRGVGRSFKAGASVKAMKGSEEGQIVRPLKGMMENVTKIVKNANRNMIAARVVDLVERGGALGIRMISRDPYATPELAEKAIGQYAENEFPFYRQGHLEKWSTDSADLALALKSADTPAQADFLTEAFTKLASGFRVGVTSPIDFAVRMTTIDQWIGFAVDPNHPFPYTTTIAGIADMLGGGKAALEWKANGGAAATASHMDANYIARDMHRLLVNTGASTRFMNAVQHPFEFAQLINERIENLDRIGYFMQTRGKVGDLKAATMSREYKLDWAEKGTGQLTNWIAKVTPFYRAGMLGARQISKGVVANPGEGVGAYVGKPVGVAFRAFLSVSMLAAGLYALNYWQDEYGGLPEARKWRNRSDFDRDTQFITPEIGGQRFKMPMPREIGVLFGGGVNRFLDFWARNDKHAFEGWASNFIDIAAPPVLPTAVRAPIEGATNHSFFTGHALVPGSLEGASPDMEYTANTTEVAKGLSRVLSDVNPNLTNWSPMVIENYVKNFGGGIGMAALHILDIPIRAFEGKDQKPFNVADVPFVQGLIARQPGMSARPIQEFYEAYHDMRQAQTDKSLAKKRSNADEMADAQAAPMLTVRLQGYAQTLSISAEIIQAITDAPVLPEKYRDTAMAGANTEGLTAQEKAISQKAGSGQAMTLDEKRQFIEATYSRMILVSRQGLAIADAARGRGKDPVATDTNTMPGPPPGGW